VEAQFEASFGQGAVQRWSFAAPGLADVAPRRAYSAAALGHTQGFVRLNGPAEAYAMVHSKGTGGIASLSFIGRRGPTLELESLYRLEAAGGHTSGVFVLGRYVGLIEAPGQLALIDAHAPFDHAPPSIVHRNLAHASADAPFTSNPRQHGLTDWSGGVAMAKLSNGKFLLLANQGGAAAGRSHLFEVAAFQGPEAEAPVLAREIGEWEFTPSSLMCGQHHHSENVSLITECGTGQIYAVHVGSSDSFRTEDIEPGDYQTFWRLSRVVVVKQHASLEPVGTYLRKAHYAYCHGRSAGSAFVDPETRRIGILCHERAQQNPRRGPWRFWSASSRLAPRAAPTAWAR
jgi:hypothetical protein